MTPGVTEDLLAAVAPLHEAPQDTAAWQSAFGALARAIPCEQGTLFERLGDARSTEFGLVVGTDPRFLGEYQREYHRIDPFAAEDMVSRLSHLGRATRWGDMLRDTELQRTPYYSQFLIRYGELQHGVGGCVPVADDAQAHIWLLRGRGHDFDERDRRRMDVFLSHARAALRQRRWLSRMQRERDAALGWMDCWSDPTFVLDARGALIVSNLEGERLLHAGDLLVLRQGRLRPARSLDPDWVQGAVLQLGTAARTGAGPTTRCLQVPTRREGVRLHAVLTLAAGAASADTRNCEPHVVLIVRDLAHSMPQFQPEQLSEMFGFTAAESRVANSLLSGRSVEDIATATRVRRDTVRAHVKRMLAKTGTRKQSELQKILVKALPNLRSLRKSELLDGPPSERVPAA